MRNSLSSITALAAALFLLGGCNKAESPGEVAHDTQEAQQEGQQDVAKAEQDAASDQMAANQAMPGVESPAENNYEILVARAEAGFVLCVAGPGAPGRGPASLCAGETCHAVTLTNAGGGRRHSRRDLACAAAGRVWRNLRLRAPDRYRQSNL